MFPGSILRRITACIIGYSESSDYHSRETNLARLDGGSVIVSSPPTKENVVVVMRIRSAAPSLEGQELLEGNFCNLYDLYELLCFGY
jgi:hypothetical protein